MHRLNKLIFALIPPALAVSIGMHILLPSEGDKGWLLHAAHLWLGGNPLYIKVFEVNPPLILWLYAIPVWLSLHVPGITDYGALACIGLIATFFSSWIGTKLIARHPAFAGDGPKQFRFAVLLLLIFIFYTTQACFFDREHIMIVLGFPYIIRFMPQLAGRRIPAGLSTIIGCMAAIAFCIKPHAMLVFGALQVFALIRARSIRPLFNVENALVTGLAALYLMAIWHFTPEYFRVVVPMAYDTYYTFRNDGTAYIYLPPLFIGIGLVFADFRPWQQTPYRGDVLYFAWLCLVFLAYALINNGWGYTYNPLYSMFMLTTGWMLWEYDWLRREAEGHGISARKVKFGLRGCFLVFMVHAAYMCFYLSVMSYNLDRLTRPCFANPDCYRNSPYVSYFMEHNIRTFGTITFEFSSWVALMHDSGADWVTRFNHMWMLPRLMLAGENYEQKHYWIVDYVARGLADDLDGKKPDAVLVDRSPGLMGVRHPFSLLRMLGAVPEFNKAWSHYHYRVTFNGCGKHYEESASECRYDLYTREQ